MAGLFVPLSVNYFEDPKILAVGPNAELLYIRSLAFVKRTGSDGYIAANQLPMIAKRIGHAAVAARRLVEVGLWSRHPRADLALPSRSSRADLALISRSSRADLALPSRNGDGWYVTAWLRHNQPADELRAAKSTAGTLGNHARWHVGSRGVPKAECVHCQQEGLIR